MGRGARLAACMAVTLGVSACAVSSASAFAHLWQIDEVYLGNAASPQAAFIELHTAAPAENLITGAQLDVFAANGALIFSVTPSSNLAGSTTNRRLLFMTPEGATQFSIAADVPFSPPRVINPNGGGACWVAGSPVDCVTWGTYTGPALGSPAGTPAAAIADGCSIDRSADTDNSSTDFSAGTATPTKFSGVTSGGVVCAGGGGPPDSDVDGVPDRADSCPNAASTNPDGCPIDSDGDGVPDEGDACANEPANTPSGCPDSDGDGVPDRTDACPNQGAATANGCPASEDEESDTDPPNTTLTKTPANKLERSTAVYRFRSDEAEATFLCKLDRKPFKPCESPQRVKRLDEGRHTFKVKAVDAAGNVDPTPDSDRFKVV